MPVVVVLSHEPISVFIFSNAAVLAMFDGVLPSTKLIEPSKRIGIRTRTMRIGISYEHLTLLSSAFLAVLRQATDRRAYFARPKSPPDSANELECERGICLPRRFLLG